MIANNNKNNNNDSDNNQAVTPSGAGAGAGAGAAASATPLNDSLLPAASESPGSPVALIYRWLFDPEFKGGYQSTIDGVVAILIVLSVFAVILETIPEIHTPNAALFHLFDLITVGLFTIEYALRVLTAPMLPEGVAAKVEAREREDYVGQERVQTDENGRPVMSVVTTRDDGQDAILFMPSATADGRAH